VSEGRNYNGIPIPKPATRPDLEQAKIYWVPSISPTTLLIYSGRMFPQWRGNGFIGSLSGESLIRVTFSGNSAQKAERWQLGKRIRWVGQGPEGAIYLLEDGDGAHLVRLTPTQVRR
jgi:glucose/arabinose dehydrogenase